MPLRVFYLQKFYWKSISSHFDGHGTVDLQRRGPIVSEVGPLARKL